MTDERRKNFSAQLHIGVICRGLGGQGSVPSVVLRQAQELARYARITLISDSFPSHTDPSIFKVLVRPANVSFLRRFSHVPREVAFAYAVKRCLYRLQKTKPPLDFVHCHGHSLIVMATPSIRQQFKVQCSLAAHGDVFSEPAGTSDPFLTRFFKWVIPRGYAEADLVIALSPHMRERAIASGADPSKIEIIPNGIGIEEIGLETPNDTFAAAKLSSEGPDVLKILFVGSLSKVKGIDVLLGAAKVLKEANIPFKLRVIGSGPLRSELEEFVELNELKNEVLFDGIVQRVDLAKVYQWADVTCVPSKSDQLPTVALESLAAGTPVVGSAIGGIPFIVAPEVNGLLVPPMDSNALASALVKISRTPSLLRRLTEASAASVLPRFSWERNGKSLIEAMGKSLKKNVPGS